MRNMIGRLQNAVGDDEPTARVNSSTGTAYLHGWGFHYANEARVFG
jgi:hypothetical protein